MLARYPDLWVTYSKTKCFVIIQKCIILKLNPMKCNIKNVINGNSASS